GFAPQINRIVDQVPVYRQTLLFSATMPPEVEALARKYLRKPVVVQVGVRSAAASTVTHAVYPVPREKKNALLVQLLTSGKAPDEIGMVRTIERMIGTPIPRISVPGFDFGTVSVEPLPSA